MNENHSAETVSKQDELFKLIDKAGGPTLVTIKELNFQEKMKVSFNIWAFLFTIFYYIYKKMWKKGIVYFVVTAAAILLVDEFLPEFEQISWLISSAIFATRANIDLYKKEKLDSNGWY